jgi:hypothetical protein
MAWLVRAIATRTGRDRWPGRARPWRGRDDHAPRDHERLRDRIFVVSHKARGMAFVPQWRDDRTACQPVRNLS